MQCKRQLRTLSHVLWNHSFNSHNSQGFLSQLRQSFCPWHLCTQKPSQTSTHPHRCLITELQNSWGWKAALEITQSNSAQRRVRYSTLLTALSSWVLNASKEEDSIYDKHVTELFQQGNGSHSFLINITGKSNPNVKMTKCSVGTPTPDFALHWCSGMTDCCSTLN